MNLPLVTAARQSTTAVRLLAVWAAAFAASSVANVAVGTALRAILNLGRTSPRSLRPTSL
ncbi:MAG: hypothetical protein M3003_11320 [Candidatus Dormibacteraeota bacterium]|nr:hypothetical protein [Candidatus Dormibacteraeota bacterium]